MPKIVGIDTTLTLGRFQYASMQNASTLRNTTQSLSLPIGGFRLSLPEGWRNYACAIDRSASEPILLWSLFADLKRRAKGLVVDVLGGTDPVLDTNIREQLETALRSLETQIAWYEAQHLTGAPEEHARVLQALWEAREAGAPTDVSEWLWAPIDRVPRPSRPGHMRFATRGALSSRAIYEDEVEHTRQMFHGMTDEEITTLELFARCSYEHPDMPEEFHAAMARQMFDESRHAQACINTLEDFGGTYGDLPISTGVYDFHYHHAPCEPGSKRELLWRLLLRSTFEEALSLDGFVLQIKKRAFYGQEQVTRVLGAIMSDEIFHVRSGVRWSTYLCNGDRRRAREEREQAHAFDLEQLEKIRREFVMANPEQALEELAFMRMRDAVVPKRFPFSLDISINRAARKAAGMDDEDMAQVVEWGYAKP
ncbi:DUF455 family protein [Polyangium jinanense]|uniref:DUF455 family protein n=1 Tax=Polyangium jinanense TaxID=2829994 RepID=A0A9X3X7L4_9BACT|nr:DUF455 family protein [Polyangium jinanense]MDC3961122.1 DUF455 family protein [Polyangium jinanense]MDC3982801.1 DUF455 family protein [Polyangium jinanense]